MRILITGATSAIGSALALHYAAPGVTLVLQGRRQDILERLGHDCQSRGAHVSTQVLDLRDFARVREWLQTVELPDLLILNAGVNAHATDDSPLEPWNDVCDVIDVNLKSAMLVADCVVPAMRARGQGQIALMSSLAAYFGLPLTPSYSASKAGMKAYGEALRALLAPHGVKVNVVMPGYVKSPMCDAMPGPKPWVWTPQRAAQHISRGLQRNKARISFPFPLNWGTWWLAVLPAAISQRIVRWAGYGR